MKKARAIRLLQKHWPLTCGLIIGIMMCAALQSFWGVMFGVIGYWYFGSELMNPKPQRVLTYEEYLEAVKRRNTSHHLPFDPLNPFYFDPLNPCGYYQNWDDEM